MLKTKKRLILLIISILAIILSGFLGIKVSAKYIFNTPDYHIGDISYTASDTQLNLNYVENYTSNVIKTKSSYKVRNNKKNKEAIKVFFNDNSKTSLSLNGVTITKPKTIGNYDFFKIDTVSDPYNITIRYKEKTTKTLQYLDNFTNEVLKTETLNVYTGDDYNITPTKIEHYDFNKSDKALTGKNAKNDTIKIYEEIKYSMFDFNPDANKYGNNYSQGARIKSFDAEVFYKNGTSIKKYTGISDYYAGEHKEEYLQKIPYQGWIIFSNITYREGYEYQSTYFENYEEHTILENNPNGKFSNVSSNGFKMIQINDGFNCIVITTSPIKYNIKYNLNGGSVTGNPTTYTVETADFTLKNPTRTGYTFTGWSGSATGTTVKIAKGSTGDKSFTANFKANTYKVKFDGNGATSGTMPDLDMTYDTPKNVTTNTFTKTGYTFDGWNTAKDGTGTNYTDKQSVKNLTSTNGATVTLYAKWTAQKLNIIFNKNDGSGQKNTQSLVYDGNMDDNNLSPTSTFNTRTGYTFTGWSFKSDGSDNTNYPFNNKIGEDWFLNQVKNNKETTINLYGQWTINKYRLNINVLLPNGTETYTTGEAGTIQLSLDGGKTYTGDIYNETTNCGSVNYNTDIRIRSIKPGAGMHFGSITGTGTIKDLGNGIYQMIMPASASEINVKMAYNNYTLTVNANGGTWSGTTPQTIASRSTVSIANPTRTGYTFAGWTVTGTGASITDGTFKMGSSNATLTAKWNANTYTVKFNGNGSTSGTTANLVIKYDETKPLTDNGFQKTGYTFDGWNTKADGTGTNYSNKQEVKNLATTGTVNLYAKWNIVNYSITYNLNGGTDPKNPATYNINTADITLKNPTRTGYTFLGWSGSATGTTVKIAKGSTGDKSFTANFKANTYKVKFDGNGATSGTMPDLDMTYDTPKNVTTNTFTKTGYTFDGWNTAKDGTGKDYGNSQSINNLTTKNGDSITFYAKWKANSYTIKFDGNGATSGTTANLVIKYDETKPLTDNGFQKTGYTFDGWNTKADGTGTNYTDKQSVKNLTATDGETVTLYAKWNIINYSITYNLNGGTDPKNPATYNINTADITLKNPTRTGYTFTGWSGSATGTTVKIAKGSTGNKTFTANWKINQYYLDVNPDEHIASFDITVNGEKSTGLTDYYQQKDYGTESIITNVKPKAGYSYSSYNVGGSLTKMNDSTNTNIHTKLGAGNGNVSLKSSIITYKITYNLNGGSVTGNPATYTVETADFTLKNPTRTGYTFTGWSGSATGTAVKIAKGSTGNKTFTANFKANTYTIKFDGNTATGGATANLAMTYDTAKNLTANSFTKQGYTFAGWNTAKDGTGTNYTDKQSVKNLTATNGVTITLYAKWTPNSVKVTFNGNSGTIAKNGTQTFTSGKGQKFADTGVTRKGYTLLGWADSKTATTKQYDILSGVTDGWIGNGGTRTLYAVWKLNTYKITYNLNGGVVTGNPTTYTVETSDFTLKNPTRTGYTFTGWSGSATGTTVKIAKGSTGDKSFTANWKKNEEIYNITYNLGGGKNNASNPSTYKTTDNTITIQDPTRDGYLFVGWTGSNSLFPEIGEDTYNESKPYYLTGRDTSLGNEITVTPGKTYRVFVAAKRVKGDITLKGGLWYTQQTKGDPWQNLDLMTSTETLSNGYTLYYRNVTVPDGKQKAKFYLQLEQDHGATGTAYNCIAMGAIEVGTKPTISKGSKGNKKYYAHWIPNSQLYAVDVNPVIQNEQCNSGKDGFTFDVYENGVKVSENVIDYYSNNISKGTEIRVVVHPRNGYNILYWTDAKWTVTDNLELKPTWWDNIAPTTDNGGFFRVTECHRYWWVSKNMWATNGASDYRVVAYVYDGGTGIDFSGGSGGMYMNSTANQYWHKMGDSFTYSSSIGNGISHSPMFAKDCGNGWFKFWTVFTCTGPDKTVTFKMDIKDRAGNNRHLEFNYNTWWSPTDENIGTEGSIRSERGNDGCGAKFNPWSEEEDEEENNIEFFAKNTNITLENETKEENTISENIIKNENTNTLENTTSSKNITLEEKDNKVKENNTSKDNKVNEESINSSKAKVNNFEASENLVSDDKSSEKENK